MATNIPWTELKALSFDIYGTLIDWQNGIIDAALATSVGKYLPEDGKQVYHGLRKHDEVIEKEHPTMKKSEVNAIAFERYAAEFKVVEDGKTWLNMISRRRGRSMGVRLEVTLPSQIL
jgi:FMN phosphatase YigB (HAD superfamily)